MDEDVDDTTITPEEAEAILDYLYKYEYATLRHVIFYTLWHTGIRTNTLHAFDVPDFYPQEGCIKSVLRRSVHTQSARVPSLTTGTKAGLSKQLATELM